MSYPFHVSHANEYDEHCAKFVHGVSNWSTSHPYRGQVLQYTDTSTVHMYMLAGSRCHGIVAYFTHHLPLVDRQRSSRRQGICADIFLNFTLPYARFSQTYFKGKNVVIDTSSSDINVPILKIEMWYLETTFLPSKCATAGYGCPCEQH